MILSIISVLVGIDWDLPVYNLDIQHSQGASIYFRQSMGSGMFRYGFGVEGGSLFGRYHSDYSLNFVSPFLFLEGVLFKNLHLVLNLGYSYLERSYSYRGYESGTGILGEFRVMYSIRVYNMVISPGTGVKFLKGNDMGVLWSLGLESGL